MHCSNQDPVTKSSSIVTVTKTESTRKLSNFNFQWTKTLCQNNLKHIAFIFIPLSRAKDVINHL